MKTLTKTHIAQVRQRNLNTAEQVIDCLDWDWAEYTAHQFDEYMKFTETICCDWKLIAYNIQVSPVFRGFWNNEWNARNETEFLPFAHDVVDDQFIVVSDGRLILQPGIGAGHFDLESEYLHIHSFERLLNSDAFLARYEHIIKLV